MLYGVQLIVRTVMDGE